MMMTCHFNFKRRNKSVKVVCNGIIKNLDKQISEILGEQYV